MFPIRLAAGAGPGSSTGHIRCCCLKTRCGERRTSTSNWTS